MFKKVVLKIWFKLHSLIANYYWLPKIKKNQDLYELMKYFEKKSNSTGVGYGDVLFLYNEIKKRKPKNILEFSTGASTAYMALAIKEVKEKDKSYNPNFYSLENHSLWMEHQIDIFPKKLKPFVNIIKSEINLLSLDSKTKVVEYSNMPNLDYDFIHVDGPNGDFGTQVVKNVIDILNKSNNQELYVIFDTRMIPTKETYKRIDKNKYIWDRSLITWLVGNNIIRRR